MDEEPTLDFCNFNIAMDTISYSKYSSHYTCIFELNAKGQLFSINLIPCLLFYDDKKLRSSLDTFVQLNDISVLSSASF